MEEDAVQDTSYLVHNEESADTNKTDKNQKIAHEKEDESSEDEVLSQVQQKIVQDSLKQPIAIRKKTRTVKQKKFLYEDENSDSDKASNKTKYHLQSSKAKSEKRRKKNHLMKGKKIAVCSNDSDKEPNKTKHQLLSSKAKSEKRRKKIHLMKGKKIAVCSSDSDKEPNKIKHQLLSSKEKSETRKNIIPLVNGKKVAVSSRARNIGWKKKATTLNKKKKNTPGRPKTPKKFTGNKKNVRKVLFLSPNKSQSPVGSNVHLTEAKQKSLATFRARQILYKMHTRSLDALLCSNGLKRQEIKGDGNCFFNAISIHVGSDPYQLRNKICNHLHDHADEYKSFLTNAVLQTDEQQLSNYQELVNHLMQDGNWSSDLADALPLAAANALKKELMIFSSARDRPIFKIQPTLSEATEHQHIPLAHIAIPGLEHYDACVKPTEDSQRVSPCKSSSSTPVKQQEEVVDMSMPKTITPRKEAKYRSPKRKFRSRKQRMSQPELWKKNVRKQLRLAGKQYVTTSGKLRNERAVQSQDCTKCRYKCSIKVSEEKRNELFSCYWKLQDYNRQKDFICSTVRECAPERIRPMAKRHRKTTRYFSFYVNGDYLRVCKMFYLKTLDIGEKTIESALRGNESGTFQSKDKRGNHRPHNKTPEASADRVRHHIESFPVMEPHYTRKDTHRQFLGSDLNIKKMYELYKSDCIKTNSKPVGASKYRKIFCEEYNFSFHTPKKDQCRSCNLYLEKQANDQLKEQDKESYDLHIQRKLKAREEKAFDKNFSKSRKDYHTATFDLQSVLHTPCSKVSQVYYKRKLNCYNSSFYSLADGRGTCFMWNETEGKRGSNEIGTCILTYVRSLPPTTAHVCLYSDNCSGQNRNRFVSAAILHAIITSENISTIDQKFLEPGHTEMECDSMHAAIEAAKKHTSIYVPSQWDTIVRMARKKKPYEVIPIKYSDIYNFREIAKKLFPPTAVDSKGHKVKWMKFKWIQFRKHDPDCMFFKYEYDEEEFHYFRMKTTSRKSGVSHIAEKVPRCYSDKLPISVAKKNDLLSLCSDGTIPEEYYHYYNNMKCSDDIGDTIPEPDLYDEVEDTDDEISVNT